MYTRFEIEPDYADALRAAGLADFDALMNAPAGPPTSKHRHRETVPIEFDVAGQRKRFFLKRVFKVPAQHAWRPWLHGKPGYSQPVREWDAIRMMRDAGIPVMKRVAVGERRKYGIPTQALILVEDVGMQWTLENWLVRGFTKPPHLDHIDTQKLWFELGKLQRNLYTANIAWPDMHAKHIHAAQVLVSEGNAAHWRIALIDLERAARRRPLPVTPDTNQHHDTCFVIPRELNLLLKSLTPPADGSAGWSNFFAGYLGRQDAGSERQIPNPRSLLARWMEPLPLPDGYVHPRAEPVHWKAGIKADEYGRAMLERMGIRDVAGAFALNDAQNLGKPGLQPHRDRLRIKTRDENGREIEVYIKRYRRPPVREQLRRILESDRGHSTGYREYQASRRLMESGIPSMRAVAVGEEMCGWCERRSFVVTIAVEGESLETLARKWQKEPDTQPTLGERWELIQQVAFLKCRLRESHFFHRDLYLSHIFLTMNAQGEFVLQLIDLARMLYSPHSERRWETKDLAALAYSVPSGLLTRTDRLRFLRAMGLEHFRTSGYLRRADRRAQSHRQQLLDTIRRVERRVAKMARHDAKRAVRFARSKNPT